MKNLSEKLKSEIVAYIQKNQPEYYWDYNDELSKSQISKIFLNQEGFQDAINDLENEIMDNNWDYEGSLRRESLKSCMDYFENDISEELDSERENWEQDFEDWFEDYVSVDLNIKELIQKTSDQVFFFDTGLTFGGYGQSPAEYRLERIEIKKLFKITDSRFDEKIDDMILQASYGGQLVVYFTLSIDEFIDNAVKANMIEFSNANIAIINTNNGSGGDCQLNKHKFTLPFNINNIFYENSVHYNYSFEVCGMTSDWCSDTCVKFLTIENAPEVAISKLNAVMEEELNFDKIFAQGKCSFSDIKFNRHRNIIYTNNFPCGHVCQDCGRFWVD